MVNTWDAIWADRSVVWKGGWKVAWRDAIGVGCLVV